MSNLRDRRHHVTRTAKIHLPHGTFVLLTGLLASVYIGSAGVQFGVATGPLFVALGLIAVACPLTWAFAPTFLSCVAIERRSESLKRGAFPFLALLALPVLWPEFLLGNPSKARVISSLLAVGGVFFLLALLVSVQRARSFLTWLEAKSHTVAFGLVILHTVIFTIAIILRHSYFTAEHGDDTAYYNQIFWSTLQGEFFRGSVTQARYFDPPVSTEFALHNSPILFGILPFYYLFPSFYTLLILRNLLLSLSGIPLYLLAKERIGGVAGIVVLAGYFLSANIFSQAINGFYPLQLIAVFLPFSFLYFWREQFWPFLLWLVLALSVREEIALTAALFGVYALFLKREWRWVLAPILLSMLWWVVSTEFVLVRSRIAMEELDAFYQTFGGGHNGALAAVMKDPGKFINLLLTRETFAYLYDLVKSTAGFPLLSLASILSAPTIAVNCLIGAFMATMRNISYHYSIVASVCIFIALIDGIARAAQHSQLFRVEKSLGCVGLALLLIPGMALGMVDHIQYGAGRAGSIIAEFTPSLHQETFKKILALVPPEASVAAPNILTPQLSYRRTLYSADRLWRYGEREIDYIILDVRTNRLSDRDRNKPKYEAVIARTRNSGRYDLIFSEDGFEVYQRRVTPQS